MLAAVAFLRRGLPASTFGRAVVCVFVVIGGVAASAPGGVCGELPDADWAANARRLLAPVSKDDVDALKRRAVEALAALDSELTELPDGATWRERWRLDALRDALTAATADSAGLSLAAAVLGRPAPPSLKSSWHLLREAVADLAGTIVLNSSDRSEALAQLNLLEEFARDPSRYSSFEDELRIRGAFARLARLRRLQEPLDRFRAVCSYENYRTAVASDYIRHSTRRQFQLPFEFRTTAGGLRLQVQAEAVAESAVTVVPNADRAELRVEVRGTVPAQISGQGDKLQLRAVSTQRLVSAQTLFLGPEGVDSPGPEVDDCSCTTLSCLKLCLRSAIAERIGERIAQRVASRQLASHDPEIARRVEQRVTGRIADEGFDVAYRVNLMFGKLYSDRLPKQSAEPRLTVRSGADGIVWTAKYALDDELGALSPPPLTVELSTFDRVISLHESAINSWCGVLSGAAFDEATYLNLLKENVHLRSPDFESLPPARRSTVVHFATRDPLRVRFARQGVEFTLGLRGFEFDAAPFVDSPLTVTVRYDIVADADGLRLVRSTNPDVVDDRWRRPLARFFPSELRPIARFRNSSFQSRLSLQRLVVENGWLTAASQRTAKGASTDAGE